MLSYIGDGPRTILKGRYSKGSLFRQCIVTYSVYSDLRYCGDLW